MDNDKYDNSFLKFIDILNLAFCSFICLDFW